MLGAVAIDVAIVVIRVDVSDSLHFSFMIKIISIFLWGDIRKNKYNIANGRKGLGLCRGGIQ